VVDAGVVSAVTFGLPETSAGALSAAAADVVLERAARADAVVIGPGLGRDPATRAAIVRIVEGCARPMVVDADALYALADAGGVLERRGSATVITPHAGEAARVLGTDTVSVGADRYAAARSLCSHRVTCVLKGAHTVIAGGDRIAVNMSGNPGLATSGTGDVLAGVVGALLAQGVPGYDAAVCGVYLHGRAGDRAAEEIGHIGLVAGDVVARLPAAIGELVGDRGRGVR
jgi:NAD(P)H-hydrate epimerase